MIRFRAEWMDAPGVRDRALARTWAQLSIDVHRRQVIEVIDVRDERGGPAHDSVYGSMLPLAQWIVEKWWFLLNEPYRFGSVSDSRMLAHDRESRRWVQRHSLLAAREGNSLPDLTLFRDGGKVVARWLHDGAGAAHPWVRFIGNGETRLNPVAAEAGLSKFVETVIARLDGFDDPEVQNLRADWAETCTDRERNRKLCEWSAQLGRDPNDPDELTGELLETLRQGVGQVEEAIRADLLEATEARYLSRDLGWLQHSRSAAADAGKPAGDGIEVSAAHSYRAYEAGYRAARALRRRLCPADGHAPLRDLNEPLIRLGWASSPQRTAVSSPSKALQAGLERSEHGAFVVVVPPEMANAQGRFRVARAVWLRHFSIQQEAGRRLATDAFTSDQQASRAFAAEFLAPARGLARAVHGRIPLAAVDQLADHYEVSPEVIRRQIENHGIGRVEAA